MSKLAGKENISLKNILKHFADTYWSLYALQPELIATMIECCCTWTFQAVFLVHVPRSCFAEIVKV